MLLGRFFTSLRIPFGYCSSLIIGSYEDWRVPTYKKLMFLMDRGKTGPAIDPIFQFVSLNEFLQKIVEDILTSLMWIDINTSKKTWNEAIEYCSELDFAGFNDWQLLNINELLSTLDHELYKTNEGHYSYINKNFKNSGGYYWSSTTLQSTATPDHFIRKDRAYILDEQKSNVIEFLGKISTKLINDDLINRDKADVKCVRYK